MLHFIINVVVFSKQTHVQLAAQSRKRVCDLLKWLPGEAVKKKNTFLSGDPTRDVRAVRQEDPLWEDCSEVPGMPRGGPSGMQAKVH